ncbi:MAG: dihydroorotase [Saprospiraceae bacterium]|nr:dihydroorotase [Saprospiraceae bacterium]
MTDIILKDVQLVNRGKIISTDVLIKNHRIEKIAPSIQVKHKAHEIKGEQHFLLPGIIDDQVHFREPGLTYKADIHSESKAAVAGGVTTFMEMPNTKPPTLNQTLLNDKFHIAEKNSASNYSFYMGVSNDNLDEALKTDRKHVCGFKVFMGSSTGNMLVDDPNVLNQIFSKADMLIATHCEDEKTIQSNFEKYKDVANHASWHPKIRSAEGCYLSSSFAIELAKKYDTRLHILHISTAIETNLFSNNIPLEEKKITSEACVHHLYFSEADYSTLGNQIKCNPAIKSDEDRNAIWQAMMDDRIDIIATDHAPHTWEEKQAAYQQAPSGLPLVQHSLNVMLDFYHQGKITLEKIVEKMCHKPAICFGIKDRGFADEGFFADLVLVDVNKPWTVTQDNVLYKCGWSPFGGKTFVGKVLKTYVNGHEVYDGVNVFTGFGNRLEFDRK